MQSLLLLREHPRGLALRPTVLQQEANYGALVLDESDRHRVVANFVPLVDFDDSSWRILNSRPVFGCLGMIQVASG